MYFSGKTTMRISKGSHEYPFEVTLPSAGIPSSFERSKKSRGRVTYDIYATLKNSLSFTIKTPKIPFQVLGVLDLNNLNLDLNLNLERGIGIGIGIGQSVEFTKQKDSLGFQTILPRTAWTPREIIQLTIELTNQRRRWTAQSELSLIQVLFFSFLLWFITQNLKVPRGFFKCECEQQTVVYRTPRAIHQGSDQVMWREKGPPVGPEKTKIWTVRTLKVPECPPSGLGGCQVIDVQYLLQVFYY
jgi:hypothetical protein